MYKCCRSVLINASYSVAQKVETYMTLPANALMTTQSTYTAQNIGAGRLDRVITGAKFVFYLCSYKRSDDSCGFDLCVTRNSSFLISYDMVEYSFRMGIWLYPCMGTFF